MSKWSNENLNKVFTNKQTGETARFVARSDHPLVTLSGAVNHHFIIGSSLDDQWQLAEQIKVIFGLDIISDAKIPKGTIAIGHRDKDGKIIITSLKEMPIAQGSFSEELREAYENRCFGDILSVIRSYNKKFIADLAKCSPLFHSYNIEKSAKEIYGAELVE